jgi:hypothetical protein
MMSSKSKDEILKIIDAELEGNLKILLDPKQKDSFSRSRIDIWKETVSNRLYRYLIEK